MFYSSSEIQIHANDYDMHLLNTLITPRVALISEKIKNHDYDEQLLKIKSDAYHIDDELEVIINNKIYNNALQKIKTTYLQYI